MDKPLFEVMADDTTARILIHAVHYAIGAGVPGDLVEFGTFTGKTTWVIARTMHEIEKIYPHLDPAHGIAPRKLHLFDSFSGLPEPAHQIDAAAPHVQATLWSKGKFTGLSAAQLHEVVEPFLSPERRLIYEGFFCDTLPEIAPATKFALVHIDSDFYESAYQILEHLVGNQMLSPGAILLFDDWNCNQASPLLGERQAWHDILQKYRIEYSDEGSYGVFGHKFIIHQIGS